ncbi:hypothetical protein J1N35_030470 [Gossypium stocksii]|uniref:Uncharacterized protein n=1 Tax=Gossypium stocksii TaxID=47602 RepID=A0A9D3ZTX1_9ROSI|nr:hypothetical protein J1N35_030470 [Gossypium stocksii]
MLTKRKGKERRVGWLLRNEEKSLHVTIAWWQRNGILKYKESGCKGKVVGPGFGGGLYPLPFTLKQGSHVSVREARDHDLQL